MISVVIPNLHSPIIDQVVGALQQQTAAHAIHEIVVAGQGQPSSASPGVSFVPSHRPLSAASARNLGAQHATGTFLLFIDADCIAAPDLVERILERHAEGYTVVGGSIALERTAYWLLSDNILSFAPFLSTAPPGPRRYLPSLNLSLTREVFVRLNGFDTGFAGAAGEDIDLSIRLRQHGHELFFEPRASIVHRPQRASARSVWNHLRAYGRVHIGLQQRYGDQVGLRPYARLRPLSGAIVALSPLLALCDIVRLYQQHPALWRYAYALPGMVWGKTAWYWGWIEALLVASGAPAPPPQPGVRGVTRQL